MLTLESTIGLAAGSLANAPCLIERAWPAQKLSIEAQKERKAVSGQTLTSLGSFWKGRKPLVLVRACILGALLPATVDIQGDLSIFDLLIGMADEQIGDRLKGALTSATITKYGTPAQIQALDTLPKTRKHAPLRHAVMSAIVSQMPYFERTRLLLRPDEVAECALLTTERMTRINAHLGTTATNLGDLIAQLGFARFGHKPRVGDPFSGGGSIPFEAARLNCEVYASDLNPLACMLTWGAIHILGGPVADRAQAAIAKSTAAKAVDRELTTLGVEHDDNGNRAKSFLYCLETTCPQTGWAIPLAPSWVISKRRHVVAILHANYKTTSFDIDIKTGASEAEMRQAEQGSVRDQSIVYEINGKQYSTPIKTLRGDHRLENGEVANRLRSWERHDVIAGDTDVFRERLYCIQWTSADSIGTNRPKTFFSAVTANDLCREDDVIRIVSDNLATWQRQGLVPDMLIESGQKTDEPIRTRGWTYWHHLFSPRALLINALFRRYSDKTSIFNDSKMWDYSSKLCHWNVGCDKNENTFYNQALNPVMTWGVRAFSFIATLRNDYHYVDPISTNVVIKNKSATQHADVCDIYITDPPYADAVNYHEIYEYFIAWLRQNPPAPFREWTWDSRRALAIKGDGHEFRSLMVQSYQAMADHMPQNGMHILMFTHQSTSVWAEMVTIFWGAGLQVISAWYIATETSNEFRKGGYVQGTIMLILRKRECARSGYKDELIQEVKAEVAAQIETMTGLNQSLKGSGQLENLFADSDLQMAGYAAALQVITRYTKIDGIDLTKESTKESGKSGAGVVEQIIELAVQVANEYMVPQGLDSIVWGDISRSERFYLKMMEIEATTSRKLDNYQNFAKAFRIAEYSSLMRSMEPNNACLKRAADFKKGSFEVDGFGSTITRALLFAMFELQQEVDGDIVLSHLRDLVVSYYSRRDTAIAIVNYIAIARSSVDAAECRTARVLHELLRNERLG